MKKRKNIKATFIAITILLLAGCQEKHETSGMVEIHPDKFVDTQLKLSDIAEELEYIQLDTARIVNPRWQIKMTDQYIFVAARDELLQYDRKGKLSKLSVLKAKDRVNLRAVPTSHSIRKVNGYL